MAKYLQKKWNRTILTFTLKIEINNVKWNEISFLIKEILKQDFNSIIINNFRLSGKLRDVCTSRIYWHSYELFIYYHCKHTSYVAYVMILLLNRCDRSDCMNVPCGTTYKMMTTMQSPSAKLLTKVLLICHAYILLIKSFLI